jgi:hypothetical protein
LARGSTIPDYGLSVRSDTLFCYGQRTSWPCPRQEVCPNKELWISIGYYYDITLWTRVRAIPGSCTELQKTGSPSSRGSAAWLACWAVRFLSTLFKSEQPLVDFVQPESFRLNGSKRLVGLSVDYLAEIDDSLRGWSVGARAGVLVRLAAGFVWLCAVAVAVLGQLLAGSSPLQQLNHIVVTFSARNRHGRPAIHILHIDVSAPSE